MSKNIWGDLLTEKGCLVVPRELRLRRRELGLSNEEYAVLLDYLDHSVMEKAIQALAELNGVTEKTIQKNSARLKRKGFLGGRSGCAQTAESRAWFLVRSLL